MTRARHSYVPFFFDDWAAATAHMPRLMRSVLFDVCLYNWNRAESVPQPRLKIMFADLAPGQGEEIINGLIDAGSLAVNEQGVFSPRAIREAEKALELWLKKSTGGKKGGDNSALNRRDSKESRKESRKESLKDSATEPEPEPEPEREEEGKTALLGAVAVVEAWNEMARRSNLAQVVKITDERRGRLDARIEEHGAEVIIAGIQRIPEFPFLMGKGERGWKAHFDWLLQPKSCTKLIEGGYEQGGGKPSGWTE